MTYQIYSMTVSGGVNRGQQHQMLYAGQRVLPQLSHHCQFFLTIYLQD